MKLLKRIGALVMAGVIVGFGAAPALAASNPWTKDARHYSIYTTGKVEVSTFFLAPSGIDWLKPAKKVTVWAEKYKGSNEESVKVCYTRPYGTSPVACTDTLAFEDRPVVEINVLDNLKVIDSDAPYKNVSAKGEFKVTHVFRDLSAPIYSDPGYDRISVSY